ncbi:phosphoribosylformylglycinamidine cyclo-ligase [Culicoidibacter larvae]|uniref:Phosphoribosylformylglycinamidine cyclo-ligase n=1 Tax=Culicoidibacter larvae TaxID=2579976 RepID=A0A5R8QDG3_9FIRM|nr:phosphoribosylformylglycinamidine cyclo-ligase [Culicoidibacter larvae]TLG74330.1 phosphoribosylformylglycinamidine cyclo-ligase [Culicoidibacter larvae]
MSKRYEAAGVNLEAGYESVERIKKHILATKRKGASDFFGNFGGVFDLSTLQLKEPVLVSGTDGVGTKLKLAFATGVHNTIGIDAVAMCVNDILTQGAEPLFFLDYIACSKNDPQQIEAIVAGVAQGCIESGMALLGGETAEMPGMYEAGEYDIAGFAVGAVEKSKLINSDAIQPGNVIIGLASSGLHSNGFSLVRDIIQRHNLDLQKKYNTMEESLGKTTLTPTKIYVKTVMALMKEINIHGMMHITGGGFYENVPRGLPDGLGAKFAFGDWPMPAIFSFLKEIDEIDLAECFQVFNMGIGFMVVVPASEAQQALKIISENGEQGYIIGEVTDQEGVHIYEANSSIRIG